MVPDSGISRLRLQTIVRLRWIAVFGQTVTVVLVHWGLGFQLPIGPALSIIALSAWLNIFLRIRFPASHRLRSRHAGLMLGFDILQLAGLLFLTGGLQNPFSLLIIVPVTVSASTQPQKLTILLGILVIAAATVLVTFHMALPWYPGQSLVLPFAYIVGVWFAVVSGIIFIALYAWRIAKEARQMSNALAATEMILAREQQLSALDGLAAAAAHGLGTPLSTITVVAKELIRELPDESPHQEDLALLHSQAQRCREILSTLTRRPDEPDLIISRLPVSHLLEEAVEPHRGLGAEIAVRIQPDSDLDPEDPGEREPVFRRNPGILYSLGNLIENAVDFAANAVRIEIRWDAGSVSIAIADDGPGFSAAVMERLGEPYVTTRPALGEPGRDADENIGLGLGFFIAKTLLERSGARLNFENLTSPETGAVVNIRWSRDAIDVGQNTGGG